MLKWNKFVPVRDVCVCCLRRKDVGAEWRAGQTLVYHAGCRAGGKRDVVRNGKDTMARLAVIAACVLEDSALPAGLYGDE